MNLRRIIWGVLLVAAFLFFNNYISVITWHGARFVLSLLGGVVLGLCLMQTVCTYSSIHDLLPDEEDRDWRYNLRVYWPLAMVAGCAYFYLASNFRENRLLAKHGLKAMGKIESGHYRSNKKGVVSNTVVRFTTASNKEVRLDVSFGYDEFKSHYIDQPVEVIYLPEYPQIYHLIYDAATYEEYTGIQSRELAIADLEKMLDTIHTQVALGACLNKISYRWEMEKTENGDSLWRNVGSQDAIRLTPGREVGMMRLGMPQKYKMELDRSGYKKIKQLSGTADVDIDEGGAFLAKQPVVLYQKGSYRLAVQAEWGTETQLHYLILSRDSSASKKISEKF